MPRHALVLAAGKGTRFGSASPKVVQPLAGRPLICHLLDKLIALNLDSIRVVVGEESAEVQQALDDYPVSCVLQQEQLGTGHAVQAAADQLADLDGSLLVLYGDTVLISKEQLGRLLDTREESGSDLVLLTHRTPDPYGYGRIVRDGGGRFQGIVEERDADQAQKQIDEVNPGFYCFDVQALLAALPGLSNANEKGEYYLTDVAGLIVEAGGSVETLAGSPREILTGINDRVQLAEAEARLREAVNRSFLQQGVSILDPATTYIDPRARIGAETSIYPGAVIEGACQIGAGCVIGAHTHLRSATLGAGVIIDQGSVVRDSSLGDGTTVGPYAHLRGNCRVGAAVRIGNFVEIKKSTLGDGSKAAHLTYLGDAEIGSDVNIGAGTITCNYDGAGKHATRIEDGAFIGSNSQLIAPVTIGRNAYVAAGSTITEDVPADCLAIARSRQVVKRRRPE